MHDQADQLRKLVRDFVDVRGELAPGAPVIALTGAQPGVGVTTTACGLARELASLGKQVVLIDANLAAPAVAQAFHVKPHGTLADVLAGTRRAVEILAPCEENIRFLAGAPHALGAHLNAEAHARLQSELAALCRQSDAVLIDAGHGMNPWIDRLWQIAQHVLLVTTPAPNALLDAYAAVKQAEFDRLDGKLQLVVTRCDAGADAARLHAGFTATCERFLGQNVKPPAVLPTIPGDPTSADNDQTFRRSVRLLAADLACDFRALAARVPRRGSCQLPPASLRMREGTDQPPAAPTRLSETKRDR